MQQTEALSILAEKIANCNRCKLSEFRETNKYCTVPGEGHPNARIMILGEAPGETEALTGKPFVGRSGKLLDQMLAEAGINREHVFITNNVKCRPPSNRDPDREECVQCRPYLDLQIQVIQPQFIICLGRVATLNLLKPDHIPDNLWFKQSLGAFRKKVHQYKGIDVIVTYHPSYLLREPDAKKYFKQDLMALKN